MHPFTRPAYENETFKDLVCEQDSLARISFSRCRFVNARFDRVDFTATEFSDSTFDHCELNLPNLTNADLKTARFKDSKLVGADFRKCDGRFLALAFENSLIDTCNFSGLKLKATPFLRCVIRETRFVGTMLAEAAFDGSDLEGTLFHECQLQGASFVQARNYAIDPLTNKLKDARFSLPEAVSLLTGLGIKLI